MRGRCTGFQTLRLARMVPAALSMGLAVGLLPERASACPGFCDRDVETACERLVAAGSRQDAATAAIGVVRAYDALAARREEFRAPNYSVDGTRDLERWCGWATGK